MIGPQAGREVLQLHLALDLLHCGTVRSSVQMPKRRPAVHWVLLLGLVEEQEAVYAIPHNGEGLITALLAWRGPSLI